MLLAQLDGASELMKVSAARGWEATIVAFFCLAIMALVVWLIRNEFTASHEREKRMADRLDQVEDFQRTTLLEALQDNSKALQELTRMLHDRGYMPVREDESFLASSKRKAPAKQ